MQSEATPRDGNCALIREEGAVPNLDVVANSTVSGTSGITNSLEPQLHSTLISKDIWNLYHIIEPDFVFSHAMEGIRLAAGRCCRSFCIRSICLCSQFTAKHI